MNNKGFTLVEILATIAILGILSGIVIGGVQKYIEKSRQQAYDTLASSSIDATKEYVMDHPGVTNISFSSLKDGDYINNIKDPKDKSKDCAGRVEIIKSYYGDGTSLDDYKYKVIMCCGVSNFSYDFPDYNKKPNSKCGIYVNVFFEGNGGTLSQTSKIVTYNSTYGSLPSAYKTGAVFAGWYSNSSLTNKIGTASIVSTTQDHTLYAKWKNNLYGFDYNPDSNKYGTGYPSGAHVKSLDLKIVSPSGKVLYNYKGISDICNTWGCASESFIEYGSTYYFTNVKYRDSYTYSHYSITNNIPVSVKNGGTEFTFKHSYPGDISFNIFTKVK